MKKTFATLLIISILIDILPLQSNTLEVSGLTFILPNLSLTIRILFVVFYILIILYFAFLTIQDIAEQQIVNVYLRIYRGYFLKYIKSKNGQKIDNLARIFPQIESSTDIFWLYPN